MNHYTAEELKAALLRRDYNGTRPEANRLDNFVTRWWKKRTTEERQLLRIMQTANGWLGDILAALPDEELMFLWACYLL